MKTKITVIVLLICSGVFFMFAYTFSRRAYYNAHPEYPKTGISCALGTDYIELDGDYTRYATSGFILSGKYISLSNSVYISSSKRFEFTLSDFETYIIYDWARNILKLHEKKEEVSNSKSKLYLSISTFLVPKSQDRYIVQRPKGNLKTNIFSLLLLTTVYSRTVLPYIIIFYAVFFLLFKRAADGITDPKSRRRYLDMPYVRFALIALLITVVTDFIFTLPPIYESYLTGKDNKLTYVLQRAPLLRCEVGYIAALLETSAVIVISKSKKIKTGIAYAVPTAGLLLIQQFFLNHVYSGYPIKHNFGLSYDIIEKINNTLMINKLTLLDIADRIRNRTIVFTEFWPFYPKLFYFTIFFAIAFVPYFISCLILNRKLKEGFCQAVAFAASNAFLVCMTSYVVRYAFRAY